MANTGLLELNGKDLTVVIDEETAEKAPLASPAFTGTATLNGNNIATTNQIPDTSTLATKTELNNYLPLAGGTITGSINVSSDFNVLTYNNSPVISLANIGDSSEYGLTIGGDSAVGRIVLQGSGKKVLSIDSTPISITVKTYDSAGNEVNILSDKLIRNSGARGVLAGYENTVELGSTYNWTLSQDRPDSMYWTSSVDALTIQDGITNTCWTKTVKLDAVPTTVTFGSNWNWVGGSAPTMVVNGLLVCTWQNNHGLINFLSPSA